MFIASMRYGPEQTSSLDDRSMIVFTDLDGSLLDHDSYRHDAAESALQRLAVLGIPCIPVTSKTREELLSIRSELNLNSPFVVENGSAVFIPENLAGFDNAGLVHPPGSDFLLQRFGREHKDVLIQLREISAGGEYHWRGFSDMPLDEIMQRTGLDASAAQNASRREFCEPVVWLDDETQLSAFIATLQAHGLQAVPGGRFLHIMDAAAGKGRAVEWLCGRYLQTPACTVALGDSGNDIDMLNAVDIAVLVRSEQHDFPQAQGRKQTLRTRSPGPAGWAEAMHQILDDWEAEQEQLKHG